MLVYKNNWEESYSVGRKHPAEMKVDDFGQITNLFLRPNINDSNVTELVINITKIGYVKKCDYKIIKINKKEFEELKKRSIDSLNTLIQESDDSIQRGYQKRLKNIYDLQYADVEVI